MPSRFHRGAIKYHRVVSRYRRIAEVLPGNTEAQTIGLLGLCLSHWIKPMGAA